MIAHRAIAAEQGRVGSLRSGLLRRKSRIETGDVYRSATKLLIPPSVAHPYLAGGNQSGAIGTESAPCGRAELVFFLIPRNDVSACERCLQKAESFVGK